MHLDLHSLQKMNGSIPIQAAGSTVLDSLYIFEGLDMATRESIIGRCSEESFESGATIMREGDPSDGKAYIILSGAVEVLICDQAISRLTHGDIFGEYALICAEDRTATVRAIDLVTCLVLDEDTLISVSNENNQINDIMIARINENTNKQEGLKMAA